LQIKQGVTMNKYWLVAACFAAFTMAACRQTAPGSTQEDEAAVVAAGEQYRRAWLEGDTAKALAVVSDDILIMAPGISDIRGRDSARVFFAKQMTAFRVPSLTVNATERVFSGDYAFEVGTYAETVQPQQGEALNIAGRYIMIWRREAPGWRLLRFMVNSPTAQ
jgi:ketosteroid isomerase-like protein